MNSKKFRDRLIEMKKQKFIQAVEDSARAKGVPVPTINFKGCSQETENSLAHFHPDKYMICVSKRQLTMLDFEDIYETATHEVAHIFEQSHDAKFHQEHQDIRYKAWKPPKVGYVYGGGDIKPTKPVKKEEIDNVRCNYHLCRKKTALEQCKYCKGYYCKDHINPIQPGVLDITKDKPESLKLKYGEGHPCPAYIQFKIEEEQRINEEFGKALNKMSKKPMRMIESELGKSKKKANCILVLILIILIVLVLLKLKGTI